MNIGGVGQQNNTLVVDGSKLGNVVSSGNSVELKNGATIQGTVVSIKDTDGGKIANINIGDSVISASLQEGTALREGQSLNFAVRGSSGSTISITPLFENTSPDQNTLRALTAAGIEINNDTINMVKGMMEASLPINKNALLDMSRELNAHPNSSITTLVEMKSLNIPINANNIQQFQNYKNYEHQVTTAMENIMDELPGAFDQLLTSGNEKGAIDLYGSVLKLFGEEGLNSDTAMAQGITEPTLAGTLAGEGVENGQTAGEVISPGNKSAEEAISENNVQVSAGTQTQETSTGNVISNMSPEEILLQMAKEGTGNSASASEGTVILEQSKTSEGQTALASGKNIIVQNPLSESFIQDLKNLGISDKAIDDYANAIKFANSQGQGNNSENNVTVKNQVMEFAQKNLLKELAKSFEGADLNNISQSNDWKKLFSSDDYNRLIKDNISSQWLLKPSDVEKKENVDNLYQRLGNQVKQLAQAVTQNLGAESRLAQSANNLQNNLDFMNQLNHMFQYVQLPLQMTGQNAHGDLYVYKNKNRKMSEDGSVSAVLHLDMEHLGPVDVYVKMLDTKVSTNFYVADEEVIDLINDNIHILNERLEKRGYSMKVNMALHEDKDISDAAVDEMLNVSRKPLLSINSFDARA